MQRKSQVLVTPKVEQIITVMLPNELTRATVTKVYGPDMIEAKLDQGQPFSRVHNFQFGQCVMFKRHMAEFGQPGAVWKSIGEAPRVIQTPVQTRQIAPPDELVPLPPRPKINPKARRRSDVEAEKPNAAKQPKK